MRVAGFVLVVCGSVLGCSSAVGTPPPTADPSAGPLALYQATEGGFSAMLEARLILEDGCLYLTDEASRWLALWPSPGTSWEGDGVAIKGARVAVGSTAIFGGGETEINEEAVAAREWVATPDPRCLVDKAWWILGADPTS